MSRNKRSAARRKRDAEILRKRKIRQVRIEREKRAAAKRKAAVTARYTKLKKIRAVRNKKAERAAERAKTLKSRVDKGFDENTPWHKLPLAERKRRNELNRKEQNRLDKIAKAEEPIKSGNPSGKGFNWKKVKKNVEDNWNTRLKGHHVKPQRLKIDFKPTGRLKKYGDGTKDGFDRNRYIKDFRKGLAERAKKRGLKGDALAKLNRTNAPKIQETKPKYGSVINDLKNKLGKINHKSMIADTTEKLTMKVKSGSAGYQQTGLDIIKGRSTEDGALPSIRNKQKTKKNK